MRLLSVSINNFLSIENSGLALVEGWNFDTGRANAAGKTAIFNAISFALYNKLPRKITASEILRRGAKSGSVTLTVSLEDGSVYTVKRNRPSGFSFKKDGADVTLTQEEFESKLKLNYDQFLVAVYCAQNTETRFLYLNDTSKKDFIVQLLGLNKFSILKKSADLKISAIEQQIIEASSGIKSAEARISTYQESLVDEDEVRSKLDQIDSAVGIAKVELVELASVQRPDLSKYASLQENISARKSKFVEDRTTRNILFAQHVKLKSKIKPFSKSDRCPTCGSAQDVSDAKARHETECSQLANEAEDLLSQIIEIDNRLAKENEVDTLAAKLKEKLSEESRQYETAKTRSSELNTFVSVKAKDRATYAQQLANNATVNSKIASLNTVVEQLRAKIQGYKQDMEIYKTVSSAYSSTGAQAYVLDSVVDSFNSRMDHYVSLVWPNVTYALRSYRENSKGDLTAKLSELLTMNGEEISIGSLSGGENRALSICADLSMIDVVSSEFSISLNPLIFDEPFDGLDHVGRELVVDLLERVAQDRQIFIVDHSSETQAKFSKVIRVEKRNGISTISAAS
jgi:DNA repair exonuclease SbcCD ATPase subunit